PISCTGIQEHRKQREKDKDFTCARCLQCLKPCPSRQTFKRQDMERGCSERSRSWDGTAATNRTLAVWRLFRSMESIHLSLGMKNHRIWFLCFIGTAGINYEKPKKVPAHKH